MPITWSRRSKTSTSRATVSDLSLMINKRISKALRNAFSTGKFGTADPTYSMNDFQIAIILVEEAQELILELINPDATLTPIIDEFLDFYHCSLILMKGDISGAIKLFHLILSVSSVNWKGLTEHDVTTVVNSIKTWREKQLSRGRKCHHFFDETPISLGYTVYELLRTPIQLYVPGSRLFDSDCLSVTNRYAYFEVFFNPNSELPEMPDMRGVSVSCINSLFND